MKKWYKTKRDEYYRAYQAALEMEDMVGAERLFGEYSRYSTLYEGVK